MPHRPTTQWSFQDTEYGRTAERRMGAFNAAVADNDGARSVWTVHGPHGEMIAHGQTSGDAPSHFEDAQAEAQAVLDALGSRDRDALLAAGARGAQAAISLEIRV